MPVGARRRCRVALKWALPQSVWRRGSILALNSSGPAAVHGAFEGLQTINLTFCLAVAPGHLDSVFYRIEIPVQCACEAHDGRQVGFDRVVDPCRERVCLAATQDTVEPHDEAAHRCEGGRASLERVDFPRLIWGEFSAGFDTQRCRDDRGDRVPRFRVPDRFQDLVLQGRALRLLFGSAPPRQQPLQMRRAPLVATLSDQTEQGASSSNSALPALAQELFKVPRRSRLQSCPPAVRRRLELQPFRDAATREPCSPPNLAAGKPLISKRMDGGENGVECRGVQDRTLRRFGHDFGHLYSPVRRICAHPRGEVCARRLGGLSNPSLFRWWTAWPRCLVFQ